MEQSGDGGSHRVSHGGAATMTRRTLVALFTLLSISLALAAAGEARTAITGTVKSKAGQPLPGLALLEKGEIHNNVWDRGVLVDANGHFTIELPEGGQYGLHVYASGYIYAPQAVRVEAGKNPPGAGTPLPGPTRPNDPLIRPAGLFPRGGRPGQVTLFKLQPAHPQ